MIRPKITIMKKVLLDAKGHFRFYSAGYNPSDKKNRPKPITINLDSSVQYNKLGIPYPQADIRTERQLVLFLYNNWGPGEYLIYGHLKGREGLFVFFRGEINNDGWIFPVKSYKDNEIKRIENDLLKTNDKEERESLMEDLEFNKEINKEINKDKRYGFIPFLKSFGRRGQFHSWNEVELEPEIEETIKEKIKIKNRKDINELSLEEINSFE